MCLTSLLALSNSSTFSGISIAFALCPYIWKYSNSPTMFLSDAKNRHTVRFQVESKRKHLVVFILPMFKIKVMFNVLSQNKIARFTFCLSGNLTAKLFSIRKKHHKLVMRGQAFCPGKKSYKSTPRGLLIYRKTTPQARGITFPQSRY